MKFDVVIGEMCSAFNNKRDYENATYNVHNICRYCSIISPDKWVEIHKNHEDRKIAFLVEKHYSLVYNSNYYINQIREMIELIESGDDTMENKGKLLILMVKQLTILSEKIDNLTEKINGLAEKVEEVCDLDADDIANELLEQLQNTGFAYDIADKIYEKINEDMF